jgi:hypothetical protein
MAVGQSFTTVNERPLDEFAAAITVALATFRRELPLHFELHKNEWVAYCAASRLGFGTSKDDLLNECLRRGFDRRAVLVRKIDDDSLHESDVAVASPDLF